MPGQTKKKIVNPEKEMRGKKPYNRSPGGLKKKTYQAKPAKLDQGEVPEGAAALRKKLRDTLRLLSKNPKMPADVRLDHERRIEALKLQIAEKQVDQTEQKMATKYRMVKFFESKKADRKIKVFMRQHPDWESNEDEKKELESLKLDLAYIQHFPKTRKYIALYPTENADDPAVSKERQEIREKIRVGLESGEIAHFVKSAREEVKAKIVSKDTLSTEEAVKLTTEKINKSKKRSREQMAAGDQENDPLSARAKATAAREAAKPKEEVAVQEEETFFETVPKVVAVAAVKPEDEPAKKKTRSEKRAAKQAKRDAAAVASAESAPVTTPQTPTELQQPKQQQKQQNNKADAAAVPSTGVSASEDGEVKKLGKWARKAIRAKSTFAVKEEIEVAVAAAKAATETKPEVQADKPASEEKEKKTAAAKTEKQPVEKQQSAAKKQSAEKKQPAKEKKPVVKDAAPVKVQAAEKKAAEKKVAEKLKAAAKPKEDKEDKEKAETESEIKANAPKLTTLKVSPDNVDSDNDSDDDAPAAPVRKVVTIDHSLLKELPEVPKRRGGRNLNKFKK